MQNRIRIPCQYALDRKIEISDARTVAGGRARRLKKASDAFHEVHEAARIGTGVPKAETARYYSGRAIFDLNVRIADVAAVSLEGLAVKGRSERAWMQVNRAEGGLHQRGGLVALFENLAALDPACSGGEVRA